MTDSTTDGSWPASAVLRTPPGGVGAVDPRSTPGFDGTKSEGIALMRRRGSTLADLQEKLYANARTGGRRCVLLVLQGMDTSGKGGIVRHVMGMVDPQGVSHASFGMPTEAELAHHFLWRVRRQVPGPGQIGVFDRSQYEDVLIVRVHDQVPPEQWRVRYGEIRDFERELVADEVSVVKVMLHISRDEQRARLQSRLDRPDKHWKYDPSDVDERAYWDRYREAYDAALAETDSDAAPWYIVPADRKWYARLAVTELLIDVLVRMDLRWPTADFDVDHERIRLAHS